MRRLLLALCLGALVATVVAGAGMAGKPSTPWPLSASPTTVRFPRMATTDPAQHAMIALTNATNGPTLTLYTTNASVPFGWASVCNSIYAGETCNVELTFSPTEAGHWRQTLSVVYLDASLTLVSINVMASGSAYVPKA